MVLGVRRPWRLSVSARSRGAGWQNEDVKEACGVFGVYAPGAKVAQLTFDGLFALQHRGQESAGMAVSDGETMTVVKDMGLVASVFDERTLSSLQGDHALGHVRDEEVLAAGKLVQRLLDAVHGPARGDP